MINHAKEVGLPRVTVAGICFEVLERRVLKGASLTVRTGEVVGLVGRRGSGKTTLLKLVAGIREPTFGVIMICGHSMRAADRTASRSRVMFMSCSPILETENLASKGIELPSVLLLDEPTAGRSAAERERFWDWIEMMRRAGLAMLIALDLEDCADSHCDRFYFIDDGMTAPVSVDLRIHLESMAASSSGYEDRQGESSER